MNRNDAGEERGGLEPSQPFLDDFPDALILLDPDGLVLCWNRGAESMFGFTREEVLGRPLQSLVTPEDPGTELEAWATAIHGAPVVYQTTRRRKDGTSIVVDATARAVFDEAGRVRHFALCKKDVTRLKYLREAEILEARYRGLLEAAPDAMVLTNKSGRIVLTNTQALRLFGYARAGLLGEPVEVLIPERFRANHPEFRDRYFKEPRTRYMGLGLDLAALRKDGSEFPAEISLSPIHAEDGVVLVAAAIRDVSAQRKVEARFKGLLEAAPDAMVIVRRDGTIVLVNGQTERLFGYSRDELIGEQVEVLVPQDLRAEHPEYRQSYFANPRPRAMGANIELAGRRKDGSEFPAEISLSPLDTEDGLLVSAAVRDVTDRRRIERQRGEAIAEQHRRLAEANRLKSEFLANMSHELRTPLNAIIGFTKLMHSGTVGPVSPDHHEYLGDILTSADHLLRLINDVLDLSKVEAGKLDFHPEPLDLDTVVNEVCEILRTSASQRQIRVAREVAAELDDICLDPSRLKQILYNYLSNALKFTSEGGQVAVRALPEGDRSFRLEVEDTGIGINPEDHGRLFVEFQQLDASTTKQHQGTGLGLALTKRLAVAQGGSVGVRSSPGRGSVFWVVLPRDGRSAPDASPAAAVRRLETAAPGPPGQSRVLVIEDSLHDERRLVQTLTEAGYATQVARTGAQALQTSAKQRFDAVTLDLELPDMSGWEVLRQLRSSGPNQTTPVVVATVVGETSAAFPVQDYLLKPIEPGSLLSALQRAGVRAHDERAVLVLDDDPSNLKLAEVTLQRAGYRSCCLSDATRALRLVESAPPLAIVLDLLLDGMDGFQFLTQLRRTAVGRVTPVVVWTIKDLTAEERARLRHAAEAVILKARSTPDTLLEELERLVPVASRRSRS